MANRTEIPDLQGLIKDTIEGEVIEQHAESLLPPGENYGSVMYKVDFKVKHDGKEKEYHAVAKCTPLNKVTQEIFNTQETFKSEIGWYTTVIPTYRQFQKEQGVDKEIDFFQKFFGARISLDSESDRVDLDGVILTENLKNLGYKNEDRHKGFNLRTTENILTDLARFHALPMAIRQKNPELFETNVTPYLTPIVMNETNEDDFKADLYPIFQGIPAVESIYERIRKSIADSVAFSCNYRSEPWITVVHLDFWVNNIMITDGEDPKTIILDLQTPGLGSPANDVIFLLLTSVNLDVIKDNLDYFFKFYYEQLVSSLESLNASTEQLTFEGFLKEIDIEAQTSQFCHAVMFNHMILADKGVSTLDSADPEFKPENLNKTTVQVRDRHIKKFEWIGLEAAKRNWI